MNDPGGPFHQGCFPSRPPKAATETAYAGVDGRSGHPYTGHVALVVAGDMALDNAQARKESKHETH